jgi:hypothetical protein
VFLDLSRLADQKHLAGGDPMNKVILLQKLTAKEDVCIAPSQWSVF